jgi:hypothetical protein
LPDGIFSSQTSFGIVWKDFELKLFIFYDLLVYFVDILINRNLLYFVDICYIIPILVYCKIKIWQPCPVLLLKCKQIFLFPFPRELIL